MINLLQSVRQRYKTGMSFHNFFTLYYRTRKKAARPRFEAADLERGILRVVNNDMLRHVEQWRQQSLRMEKQHFEADKRIKRQNDLVFAGINIQMKRLKRELAAIKAWESEQREEGNLTKETIASLAGRSAKRMLDEQADMSSTKTHAEISIITKKAVRNALRKMREEEDYERRRGRGG